MAPTLDQSVRDAAALPHNVDLHSCLKLSALRRVRRRRAMHGMVIMVSIDVMTTS